MVHTEQEANPRAIQREGYALYQHRTQRWKMRLPVRDVEHPDLLIVIEGNTFDLVEES
mgnify:CR=1 FL=1